MRKIKLTEIQKDVAEWAIDPMQDFAKEPEESGYGEKDVPYVEGVYLVFPTDSRDIVADFLYRIGEQLPDIIDSATDEELPKARGQIRAAQNLVQKIERGEG